MNTIKKTFVTLSLILVLLTAFTTASLAGRIQMKGRKVRIDQATAVHVKKTTNTAKVTANFKLIKGNPRAIIVWVYSADQKTLYSKVITAYEDGGAVTQPYYKNKPHNKGRAIAVLYKDSFGGLFNAPYKTGGYIDYY